MYYRNNVWLTTGVGYGLSSGRVHNDNNIVAGANLVTC